MSEAAESLKPRLMVLSSEERAELARFLIDSLGAESARDLDQARDAELSRRAGEIERGEAVGEPADRVFAELRERYS